MLQGCAALQYHCSASHTPVCALSVSAKATGSREVLNLFGISRSIFPQCDTPGFFKVGCVCACVSMSNIAALCYSDATHW